jgi:hypothetical protein
MSEKIKVEPRTAYKNDCATLEQRRLFRGFLFLQENPRTTLSFQKAASGAAAGGTK